MEWVVSGSVNQGKNKKQTPCKGQKAFFTCGSKDGRSLGGKVTSSDVAIRSTTGTKRVACYRRKMLTTSSTERPFVSGSRL